VIAGTKFKGCEFGSLRAGGCPSGNIDWERGGDCFAIVTKKNREQLCSGFSGNSGYECKHLGYCDCVIAVTSYINTLKL
jgi:hypothetical protein